MQSIDFLPRRGSIIRCPVLDDIRDEGLRMKIITNLVNSTYNRYQNGLLRPRLVVW